MYAATKQASLYRLRDHINLNSQECYVKQISFAVKQYRSLRYDHPIWTWSSTWCSKYHIVYSWLLFPSWEKIKQQITLIISSRLDFTYWLWIMSQGIPICSPFSISANLLAMLFLSNYTHLQLMNIPFRKQLATKSTSFLAVHLCFRIWIETKECNQQLQKHIVKRLIRPLDVRLLTLHRLQKLQKLITIKKENSTFLIAWLSNNLIWTTSEVSRDSRYNK